MTVIDASLLIDVVVGLPAGRPWRRWAAESDTLAAPDCVGVELGRYIRRHMLSQDVNDGDARRSLDAWRRLAIELYPTAPLLDDALGMRHSFSFDDALYVVLAQRLSEPLATTDGRLARAAGSAGVAIAEP
jgi:predicted nucleic acid-binding protein